MAEEIILAPRVPNPNLPRQVSFVGEDLPSAAPRIIKIDTKRLNIGSYDIDNGYPQRMELLIKASPTAKMVTAKFADYIYGQGFSVTEGKTKRGKDNEDGVWNTILNSKGQTGDKLLTLSAADYSKYKKGYFHLNYNALFQGIELNYIPLRTVRYGINEYAGKIALCDNWWNSYRFGRYVENKNIDWIDIFNPDPDAIKNQVRAAGGWQNYKGQIFCFGEEDDNYPEMILDSGLDSIEAEILSKQTSKYNIKNNFGDKVIIETLPFETKEQREEFTYNVQDFLGPKGKSAIVQEVNSHEEADRYTTIENKLDDKRFAFTTEDARATLYRLAGQSAILHSDLNQGKYNQNQLPEAIKAYNNHTERARIEMQAAFHLMLSVMGIDADCAITPINDITSASENTNGANDTNQKDNGGDNITDSES